MYVKTLFPGPMYFQLMLPPLKCDPLMAEIYNNNSAIIFIISFLVLTVHLCKVQWLSRHKMRFHGINYMKEKIIWINNCQFQTQLESEISLSSKTTNMRMSWSCNEYISCLLYSSAFKQRYLLYLKVLSYTFNWQFFFYY